MIILLQDNDKLAAQKAYMKSYMKNYMPNYYNQHKKKWQAEYIPRSGAKRKTKLRNDPEYHARHLERQRYYDKYRRLRLRYN